MATDLVCPKCQGHMRAYERSGVTVDQCGDCRGIFLDRGELEHLVDAEQGLAAQPPAPAPATATTATGTVTTTTTTTALQWAHKKRKKSFFDDLFD